VDDCCCSSQQEWTILTLHKIGRSQLSSTQPSLLEELAFLGDTRSRCELLVFAQANPARLPLTMGILQPDM